MRSLERRPNWAVVGAIDFFRDGNFLSGYGIVDISLRVFLSGHVFSPLFDSYLRETEGEVALRRSGTLSSVKKTVRMIE